MKKWYRSRIVKAVLIAVSLLSVATLMTCTWWAASYSQIFKEVLNGSGNKAYEESEEFEWQVYIDSMDIVQWISNRELFLTDGKENLDKIVDIQEFYDSTTISGEDKSGFAYRLGDLIDWYHQMDGDEYYLYDTENVEKATGAPIVCKRSDGTYHYYGSAEFKKLIKSGELQFVSASDGSGITSAEILDELEMGDFSSSGIYMGIQNASGEIVYVDCWQYDGYVLAGEYHPVEAASVMDIVNENPEWNGRLNEAYGMLEDAVTRLGSMYDEYDGLSNSFKEGDTNYFYLYADPSTGRIYTNKEEYTSFADLDNSLKAIKKLGCYVIVEPKLADFQSNIKNISATGWRDEIEAEGAFGKDFIFAAGVDTDYPIQDKYYDMANTYRKHNASVRTAALLMIPAILAFLVSIIWLVIVAGRSSEDEELHLCAFDRWKTELGAAFVIILWLIPILFFGYSYVSVMNMDIVAMGVWFVLGLYTCAMFLMGLLSLVRRIKAKTVWKNSVLRVFLRFAGMVFGNWSSVWRLIVVFGVFVVIHWFAIITTGYGGYSIGFFIAFAAEILAFVYLIYNAVGRDRIGEGIRRIAGGEIDYKISTDHLRGEQKKIAEDINGIGAGLDAAVEKSMKSERLKTDLITNVSHDIKTPLTSIINYVELLKQENFEDPKIQRYIEILEAKSLRLKTLTEDVVEASKVSSGNITLEYMNINLTEMIQQTSGEFAEKFEKRNLKEVLSLREEEAYIRVDGRRTWRILENVYNNAAKYAMEGTRIYADLKVEGDQVIFSLKNISQQPLNISADELTERFIRGDISRSTEGSGLGLSIAKTLTEMQGGKFELYLDGDLFKVTIIFPKVEVKK